MIAFNRIPQFTPTGLTDHQLARIEHLALAIIARNARPGTTWSKADAEDEATWWFSTCRMRQPSRDEAFRQSPTALAVRAWLGQDDDAWTYLVNCIKWVIACSLKAGKLAQASRPTNNRAYWAQVRGSY